MVAFSMTLSDL